MPRRGNLGQVLRFLLPSLKLRDRSKSGAELEERLHQFLLAEFGGYTATGGNVFGYWRSANGVESYGEHLEYRISLVKPEKIQVLEKFLAELCRALDEKSLYLESEGKSWLLYP